MDVPDRAQIKLSAVEKTLRQLLLDVARDQADENPELRFTGGWVRDKLLGVGSQDIDVAISTMTGMQFGQRLKTFLDRPGRLDIYQRLLESHGGARVNGKSTVLSGLHKIAANPEKSKHLETVTTRIFGLDIDLVNLRKEVYTEDSRNPQVEFGTPEEDALRRDATVNALFYNLQTEMVEDFTNCGLDDMGKSLIRTPLEPFQTFKDDPLRVLRLIRFATRLNYEIHPDALHAMQDARIKSALKTKISRERVGEEIKKMLSGPDPHRALQLINDLDLYYTVFADPETTVQASESVAIPLRKACDGLKSIYDTPTKVRELIRAHPDRYYSWQLAAFVPLGAPETSTSKSKKQPLQAIHAARQSIKATNQFIKVLDMGVQSQEEVDQVIQSKSRSALGLGIRRWGESWRLVVLFALLREVACGTIVCNDSATVLQPPARPFRKYEDFLNRLEELDLMNPIDLAPIANGRDISRALDVKAGPWMVRATAMVMRWQLDNPEGDKEGALKEIIEKRVELGV